MKFTIEQARMHNKISQAKVASQLGISTQTYNEYEKYRNIFRIDKAIKFSELVSLPMDYIIFQGTPCEIKKRVIKKEPQDKKRPKFYAVYKGDTYITSGTAKECAEAINLELASFKTIASKCKNGILKAKENNTMIYEIPYDEIEKDNLLFTQEETQ
jgi:DNA-binding XRE family transcriptional regulator